MNNTRMFVTAAFGIVLGVVLSLGLLLPAIGNVTYGSFYPRRIVDPQQRRLATWMWATMAGALVLIGGGVLVAHWLLLGLGLMCACAAVGCGVRLRLVLAHEARQQRVAQEAAFRDELEQVLRNER